MLSPTLYTQHVGYVVVADVVRRRARVVGSVNANNTIDHQRTVVLHVESVVSFDWLAPEGKKDFETFFLPAHAAWNIPVV